MTVIDKLGLPPDVVAQIKALKNLSIERDRHGKLRCYVRKSGYLKSPISARPGSQRFLEAYRKAYASLTPRSPSAGPMTSKAAAMVSRQDDPRSSVYFVRSGNRIKIGTAQNVKSRVRELQVGSPTALRLLLVIKGGLLREAELHRQFAKHRVRGEWFEADAELTDFILKARTEQGQRRTTPRPNREKAVVQP